MLRYIALAGAAGLVYFKPEPSSFISSPDLLRFLEEHRDTIYSALKYVLAIGGTLTVNGALSRWAENRWQWKSAKSSWDWPNEIAVVTGGSRGIGAVVVKELVNLGVKVAVLDLVPFADGLENGMSPYSVIQRYPQLTYIPQMPAASCISTNATSHPPKP